MSEVDKVRKTYALDPTVSPEQYARLIEVAAATDRASAKREIRFWLMPTTDPDGRDFGVVDEQCGGIIAYGADESCAEFVMDALNYLDEQGLITVGEYLSTSDGRIVR